MKQRCVLIRQFSCTHFYLNRTIILSVIADLPPKVFCRLEHPANKILYNLIVYLLSCTKYRHRFYTDENTGTCPLLSLIDFFDHMLMCSFLRRWILTRLLLCGFVNINRHYRTQSRGRSRSRCRDP